MNVGDGNVSETKQQSGFILIMDIHPEVMNLFASVKWKFINNNIDDGLITDAINAELIGLSFKYHSVDLHARLSFLIWQCLM